MVKDIIRYARECVGTPFVHQGRVVGAGIDCAGVVVHVVKSLNLPFNDIYGYPDRPYNGMLEDTLNNEPSLKKISKTELSAGDICLFSISRHPQHLAIYTGETIIHSYSTAGKCIEQPMGAWVRKLVGVYRVNNV